MATATNFERERLELAKVLGSSTFNRSPNLASLLSYVCQKYFEGKSDQLKEYNLAVEALGRSTDFDNKKDSVVRVEVHRLRKRLQDYYLAEGADHPIEITIPSGQYAPKFIYKDAESSLPTLTAEMTPTHSADGNGASLAPMLALETIQSALAVVTPTGTGRRTTRTWLWITLGGALLAAVWGYLTFNQPHQTVQTPVQDWAAPTAPSGPIDEVRILAGATQSYQDSDGRKWSADRYFHGGSTFNDPQHTVFATPDPKLYRSRREGSFRYDIPLKPGVYEMRLYFAETLYGEFNIASGGESTRVFSIRANGKPLLSELDVIADAGPSTADIRAFKDIAPADDGFLHLQFDTITNLPFLNAIEITSGLQGRLKPIRLVARDHSYTDKQGRLWEPDRYAKGGQLVKRTISVTGADDPEIYGGERFGNLTYSIPVPPGRYQLRLHFAETWFGPSKPGQGGIGDRIFDVLCNGVTLFRNFDIFKEAGGGDRELIKVFHNIEPTPQGRIQINMVPRRNYACVNAIEVIDESK